MTTQWTADLLSPGRDLLRDFLCGDLLRDLSDDDLLRRAGELTLRSRAAEAQLLAHLGEIDARRLYLKEACSSMFAFCTERLHFSEGEAWLRITAARAAREHPVILGMLADGRLHLSAVACLAPHLTADNRDTVLSRAVHRSKREVLELVAELSPRPDAPSQIRRLPPRVVCRPPAAPLPSTTSAASAPTSAALSPVAGVSSPTVIPAVRELCPAKVDRSESPISTQGAGQRGPLLPSPAPVSHRAGALEPLAPGRYKVQFTASAELRDKLERLRALMRSTVANGDLATIIEEAVTEKLARLERRRSAASKRPRKSLAEMSVTPSSRHVPAPVRRAVSARDSGRCTYRDAQGRRCTARVWLQHHHRHPYGYGGDHSVGNVALMCGPHNRLAAEIDYGTRRGGSPSSSGSAGSTCAAASRDRRPRG